MANTLDRKSNKIPGIQTAQRLRLRTKLLISVLAITSLLTAGALLVIRRVVKSHVETEVESALQGSANTFATYQERNSTTQERTAALIAELPSLKALLTTHDAATIQDGTGSMAAISGAQLFMAGDTNGAVLAVHSGNVQLDREKLGGLLKECLRRGGYSTWWYVDGHLYQVVIRDVSAGAGEERRDLGVVVQGSEIDEKVARGISEIASGQVAFVLDGRVVLSTLRKQSNSTLEHLDLAQGTARVQIGDEDFLALPVTLRPMDHSPVLIVLRSLDEAAAFVRVLNWLIIVVGFAAVGVGTVLVFAITSTITSPVTALVEGFRALEEGNFEYPLAPAGSDELGELTEAFQRMRSTLRTTQDQLMRSSRMEALGRLAGGVAHDFNNLVTIINGYGQMALDKSAPESPVAGYVQEIRKAGDRATALTRQLLAFSRRQVMQQQPVDLNTVVGNINKMLRVLIGEDVQLVISQGSALAPAMADPAQLEQVIMNLAANARDAMSAGGTLTIETSMVDGNGIDAPEGARVASRYVRLSVIDTGQGIDRETQAHIFEPFFTTKAPGKGTGLGLATVYGIVRQSEGFIAVQSELNRGTTFHVYLPATEGRASELADASAIPSLPVRGTETILVVEDEEPLRRFMTTVLEENGYQVVGAGNGREALERSRAFSGKIHLVITDVIMPEMGGKDLIDIIARERPQSRILLVSGYTDRTLSELGIAPGLQLLAKPFTPQSLLGKVREVLGSFATTSHR